MWIWEGTQFTPKTYDYEKHNQQDVWYWFLSPIMLWLSNLSAYVLLKGKNLDIQEYRRKFWNYEEGHLLSRSCENKTGGAGRKGSKRHCTLPTMAICICWNQLRSLLCRESDFLQSTCVYFLQLREYLNQLFHLWAVCPNSWPPCCYFFLCKL